jgi:hypothetical protein
VNRALAATAFGHSGRGNDAAKARCLAQISRQFGFAAADFNSPVSISGRQIGEPAG